MYKKVMTSAEISTQNMEMEEKKQDCDICVLENYQTLTFDLQIVEKLTCLFIYFCI